MSSKQTLRRHFRAQRDLKEAANQSIQNAVVDLIGRSNCGKRHVGIYWPLRGEADLRPLRDGPHPPLALPVADGSGGLIYRSWSEDPLQPDGCGIPAPTKGDALQPDQLALLLSPGVLTEQEPDVEALHQATTSAAKACFEGLREQRLQEGEKLADMVRLRTDAMRVHLGDLREQLPALQAANRQRLLDRLQSLDIDAEPMRLEEEIVYVLQRADVEEEMDRLDAHLDAIESALESTAPVGRRLDFLMQELNREANTLGSKSTALSTTNTSVEFKVLIEQMREQVQNIE